VLEPGCAYVGRGDGDVIVARRAAGLVAMAAASRADYPWHPSTDRLVRSNSVTPVSRSNFAIWWLSADCTTWQRAAAA